ncbi:hypothetical protein PROFUN_11826 [Planoprotostelium fungivorum]|uniref:Uncharacterized protein n=1 Tax=Planoprotostelium fungivorum TaxID=1890364 RepID=A0A2P6N988_9EUKA|nr:hypothetical protein PROFUN_11826 [Planoprotostelium fungivorum]
MARLFDSGEFDCCSFLICSLERRRESRVLGVIRCKPCILALVCGNASLDENYWTLMRSGTGDTFKLKHHIYKREIAPKTGVILACSTTKEQGNRKRQRSLLYLNP